MAKDEPCNCDQALALTERTDKAIQMAVSCGGIDGSHHKDWVIDQMVRILAGSDEQYQKIVADACDGEDGPKTYSWEEGIAP
jgi:hypothetical protein